MKWFSVILLLGYLLSYNSGYSQSADSIQNTGANVPTCMVMGHCCCCAQNDLTPEGVMYAHTHEKGMFMASYSYMDMNMSNYIDGRSTISNNTLYNKGYEMTAPAMNMQMHMVMLMCGITNKLTLMAMGSYNTMNMPMHMLLQNGNMNMPGGWKMPFSEMGMSSPYMSSYSSGFGDASISGIYRILDKGGQKLLLSGGVSIPSGNFYVINTMGMYPKMRASYDMQPGSGTWDILPAVTCIKSVGMVSWGASGSAIIRTGKNALNYELGNQLNLTSWVSYKWKRWVSTSLRAEGMTLGTIKGNDPEIPTFLYTIEPGANPSNYGGQRLNAYAGINFYFFKGFLKKSRLAFEYGLPLYQNLNGIQNAATNTLYAGWRIAF